MPGIGAPAIGAGMPAPMPAMGIGATGALTPAAPVPADGTGVLGADDDAVAPPPEPLGPRAPVDVPPVGSGVPPNVVPEGTDEGPPPPPPLPPAS